MSWFDSSYAYRSPFIVDNHTSSATVNDVQIAVPSDWPEFWDHVQTDGDDIRVTAADGVTPLTYDVESFDHASRTATIEIDNMDLTDIDGQSAAVAGVVGWIYWGNPTATNGETTFTVSSPKIGTIVVGVPGSGTQRMITCRPEAPGALNPRNEIFKASGEKIHLWWDLTGVLVTRRQPFNESRTLEEVANVTYELTDGNSNQNNSERKTDIVMSGNGFVRTTIQAGSSGTTMLAQLLVEVTEGRKLEFYCTIRIQDPVEP